MKKLYVISLILYLCCKTIVGSAQSNTTFIRWNSTLGVSIGYSNLHKPFKKEYHGHKAPTNLLQIDASILGLYVGTSFMSRKTGYDVYGFAERISTLGIKIGPAFRIGEYYKWRF